MLVIGLTAFHHFQFLCAWWSRHCKDKPPCANCPRAPDAPHAHHPSDSDYFLKRPVLGCIFGVAEMRYALHKLVCSHAARMIKDLCLAIFRSYRYRYSTFCTHISAFETSKARTLSVLSFDPSVQKIWNNTMPRRTWCFVLSQDPKFARENR